MSGLDHDALRKVAQAATPGPWRVDPKDSGADVRGLPENTTYDYRGDSIATAGSGEFGAAREPNAEHIATFDPPTVLDLLDEVDALEAEVERLRKYAPSPEAEALLEKSSFGSDEAKAARDSVSPDAGWLVIRLAKVLAARDAAVAERDRLKAEVERLKRDVNSLDAHDRAMTRECHAAVAAVERLAEGVRSIAKDFENPDLGALLIRSTVMGRLRALLDAGTEPAESLERDRLKEGVRAAIMAEPIASDWSKHYWRKADSHVPMLHITIEDYRGRVLTRLDALLDGEGES